MTSRSSNQRFILRLWIPALLVSFIVGALLLSALTSGQPARYLSASIGLTAVVVFVLVIRSMSARRIARMLASPDPDKLLASMARSMNRVPHGSLFAASSSAIVLALHDRVDDAERELDSQSWTAVPDLVLAQQTGARAVIAYASGNVAAGLHHASDALEQSLVASHAPGAKTSKLGFQTYRNLGLALSGKLDEESHGQLRTAFQGLPLIGRVLAAWGLAANAKRHGSATEYDTMRAFVSSHAPHCRAITHSLDAAPIEMARPRSAAF
jgi:hypothetical protein